jgi:penicillin-binding protein 1C
MLNTWRAKGAGNAAVIVLDKHSNEVLAWSGSDDYFDASHNGAIDYTQIKRSSGSILKPFIYALALERGAIDANTIIDDLPMTQYPFRNSDHRFLGPMLPRQALGNSRNIPAIRVLNRVGLDEAYGMFRRLSLHRNRLPARHFGQGMAIGSLSVRLEDVVRAYSALANEGRYRDLQWLIKTKHSNVTGEPVFSPDIARLITLFLSDPSARLPTFPRMGTTEYAFPVALKTGTSQGYRDAWTVAYSNHYIVGVWVGHALPQPMDRLNGAGSAAVLARKVMLHLHARQRQGLSDLSFPAPVHYVRVDLCAGSGKLAGPACEFDFQEWMPKDKVPHEVDNTYVRMAVDTRTGLPAAQNTPSRFTQIQTLVNLPARYADWIAQHQMHAVQKTVLRPAAQAPVTLPRDLAVKVDITSPQTGLHILRNPEAPQQNSSIALKATVEPPTAQLVWYVDDQPYKLVDYPYSTRLQLLPGKHRIQARVPMTPEQSGIVTINIE